MYSTAMTAHSHELIEEPTPAPFASGVSALSFAYRHSHGDYPPNMLGQAQRAERKAGKPGAAASPMDAAILAGWVRNVIEGGNGFSGLPEPYRSVMLAKFSVDSRLNLKAKLAVLEFVVQHAMGPGLHKHRLIDLCVQRYFGGRILCTDGVRRPIRQHQIADQCNVSQQTVSATYVRIKTWLRGRESVAMDLVEHDLRERGMIE